MRTDYNTSESRTRVAADFWNASSENQERVIRAAKYFNGDPAFPRRVTLPIHVMDELHGSGLVKWFSSQDVDWLEACARYRAAEIGSEAEAKAYADMTRIKGDELIESLKANEGAE